MSICTFVEYGSQVAPFTTKMAKIKYCEHSQLGCARYNAYQIMDADLVPDDLWPNAEIKTLEIIERKIQESHQPPHNSRRVDN
jgi:hypothetical protein